MDNQKQGWQLEGNRSESLATDEVRVDFEPLDPDTVTAGQPIAGLTQLLSYDVPVEVGVWEMTAGECRDVEADEFFVVISGSAEVTVNDGEPQVLRTGDTMRFQAGDRTVWAVQDRVRKIYVTPAE